MIHKKRQILPYISQQMECSCIQQRIKMTNANRDIKIMVYLSCVIFEYIYIPKSTRQKKKYWKALKLRVCPWFFNLPKSAVRTIYTDHISLTGTLGSEHLIILSTLTSRGQIAQNLWFCELLAKSNFAIQVHRGRYPFHEIHS